MSTTNLPANLSSFVTALEQTALRTQVAGDVQFMKMLKSGGEWVYGADETEVEEDSRWVINAKSLSTGYIAWGEGEVLGEQMALITDAPITPADLEDVGTNWDEQNAFQLACTNGEDKGVCAAFKTTSYGGRKAFKQIVDAILARVKSGSLDYFPVVELTSNHYKHKSYGRVYNPEFKVVDWMSEAEALGGAETAEEAPENVDADVQTLDEQEAPAEEKKPARRSSRRAAKESSDDEQEPVAEDKPKRRSRRRG